MFCLLPVAADLRPVIPCAPSWLNKEKDGVSGVKLRDKTLPDRCLVKTKVNCTVCEAAFHYCNSNLSLTQDLSANRPAETVCTEPHQATLQERAAHGGITRPAHFHTCVDLLEILLEPEHGTQFLLLIFIYGAYNK